jgi:hypothetical protein
MAIIAAALYGLTILLYSLPGLNLGENLIGALVEMLLVIIFLLPFILFLLIVNIVAIVMVAIAAILIGVGKTKPGGILLIVFSCIAFLAASVLFYIPMGIGIIGGILALNEK